jgi:hypothetical protein
MMFKLSKNRVLATQRKGTMTEPVFKKFFERGRRLFVLFAFHGSFLGHSHVSSPHRVELSDTKIV